MLSETQDHSRWKTPRKSIAQKFENNDYGYIFHATMLFTEFLFASNLTAKELRAKRILDYGCGTGRVSRILALTGANVVGYDPTPECITEGVIVETNKAPPTSLTPKLLTSDWSKITGEFDIAICINVLGHLSISEFNLALANIIASLKEGGSCYLWVHKNLPLNILDRDNINQKTNVVIVKGTKQEGDIPYFVVC